MSAQPAAEIAHIAAIAADEATAIAVMIAAGEMPRGTTSAMPDGLPGPWLTFEGGDAIRIAGLVALLRYLAPAADVRAAIRALEDDPAAARRRAIARFV